MDPNLPESNQAGQNNPQPPTPPAPGQFVYPSGGGEATPAPVTPAPSSPPAPAPNPDAVTAPEAKGATQLFGEASGNPAPKSNYNPLSQFSKVVSFDRQGEVVPPAPIEEPDTAHVGKRPSRLKTTALAVATIAGVIALVGGITFTLLKNSSPQNPNSSTVASNQFEVGSIPLSDLAKSNSVTIDRSQQLDINGQLRINNSLVLTPSQAPANPQTGQMYLDPSGQLLYYNGTKFAPVSTSIGGQAGTIAVGQGLSAAGNTLANTGVVTIQGQSGSVTLTAGQGISINGTTITNTGLQSVTGQDGLTVSANGGNVTIALPANLASISQLPEGGVVISHGANPLTAATAATAGLCLVSTANGPQFGSCTGQSTVTSLTPGTNGLGAAVTGAVTINAGNGLTVSSNGTDAITIASTGGTGVTSLNTASGALTIADATQAAGTITINDATTAQKGLVEIAGNTLVIAGGVLNTQQQLDQTASPSFAGLSLTSALTVANGGTGVASFTAHSVLIGSGTSAITGITGANGDCLLAQGPTADPHFAACPVGGNVSTGANHTSGTIAMFDPTNNQAIVDSLLTQSGSTITVAGSLTVSGSGSQFNGSGAGLTNLSASVINTGTLADVRLSANVALLNAANTFTGTNELKVNSTTAFQIQNSLGTSNLFIGDSVNNVIGIGKVPTLTDVPLQVAGGAQFFAAGAPVVDAAHDGTIFFNNADGKFHIIEGGVDKTLCNTVNQSCGAGTADITLQNAYSGGTSATITTADARDLTVNLADTTTDANFITNIQGTSTGKFAIQKAGTDILSVVANPTATVTVTGNLTVTAGTITGNGSTIIGLNVDSSHVSSGQLAIGNGGTGSSSASGARTNLGAAASGVNADITSLGALTTINPSSTLTVGNLGQQLILQGSQNTVLKASNGTSTTTVDFSNPTANVTYHFSGSDLAGAYTVCTTAGNCRGVGGGVTTTGGTPGTLALFSGTQAIGDSILTQAAGNINTAGTLSVNTATASPSTLTLGQASTSTGQLLFKNASSAFTVTLQAGNTTTGYSLILPTALGSGGCLKSDGTGNLSFATCLSGSGTGGGVTDLNGVSGSVTLQGDSNGISVSAGASPITISLVQNIKTTATPTFAGLSLGKAGPAGTTGQLVFYNSTGASTITLQAAGNPASNTTINVPAAGGTLAVSASGNIALDTSGNITFSGTLPVTNGGTGATTAAGARSNLGAAASGANTDITSLNPGSTLTVGGTTSQLILQGSATTQLTATSGSFTTTVGFVSPTANNAISFPNAAGTVCLSSNNCNFVTGSVVTSLQGSSGVLSLTAGSGISISGLTISNSGVLSVAGTANQVLVNGGTGATTGVISLTLPQDIGTASNVTFGSAILQNASGLTVGSSTALGKIVLGDGATAFTATLQPAAQGSNHTITVPNATGTIAVSAAGPLSLSATTGALSLGTVGITNGGTGLTTTPTNGQLLIGNTTTGGYTLANLTAGSANITITNSAGGIIIDAPNVGSCSSCANASLSNLTSPTSINVDLKTSAGSQNLGGGLSTNSFNNAYLKGSLYLAVNATGTSYFQLTGTTTGARTVTLDDLSGKALLAQQTTTPTAQNGTVSVANTQTGGSALTLDNSSVSNSSATLAVTNTGGSGAAITATGNSTVISATANGTAAAISASSSNVTSGTTASFSGTQTTGTIEQITGNSLTTGTALNVTANALTTGSGLSVSSSSPAFTSGNLISASQTSNYTTASTAANNLLNVSRNVQTNVPPPTVALDNAYSNFTMGTSLANVTVANHTGILMIISIGCPNTTAPTGVAWGSTSATFIASKAQLGNANYVEYVYYIKDPTPGTNNVSFNVGTCSNSGSIVASIFYNVNTAGTFMGPVVTAAGNSFPATAGAVPSSNGDWLIDSLWNQENAPPPSGTTQVGISAANSPQMMQVFRTPSNGSTQTTYPLTSNGTWSDIAFAIKPIPPANTSVTGAVASFSSQCTAGTSGCTDSSNILNLNQQFASATGAVLNIQNAGTGADILLGSATTGQIQTASGTTTTGINLQSGNATAGASGAITIKSGTGTTSTGGLTLSTGNASAGTAGNISIDVGTSTSSGGTISIGTANALTTTIGNSTSTSALTLQAGTGGVNIATAGVANTIQIGNTSGAVAQTISIGNNAAANSSTTLNIGSAIGTSPVTLQSGTSGITASSTATTANALALTANNLVSGTGLSVISQSPTYTVPLAVTGNIVSASRSVNTNITSTNVALDSASSLQTSNSGTISWSHTVGSVTNRLLVVSIYEPNSSLCSSVQYAGNSMTLIGSPITWTSMGISQSQATYILKNPPIGTANVVASGCGGYYNAYAGSSSWYNVDQTNPTGTVLTASSGGTTSFSLSPTSAVGDVVVDVAVGASYPVGGQAGIYGTGSVSGLSSSYKAATSPTTTMSASYSSATGVAYTAFAIKKSASPSVGSVALTGAVANFSSNCTFTTVSCADSSNILNLNQQYASATGALLNIQNAGAGVDLQTGTGKFLSGVANGASAIGYTLNTGSFTTAGAKLLSVQNNGVEKFAVDKDGNVNIQGAYQISGTQISSSNLSDGSNLAKINANNTFTGNNTFNAGGTTTFTSSATTGNAVAINGSQTTGTSLSLTGLQTTGTALALTTNALTTGTGLSVSTTSGALASGNLVTFSQANTITSVSPVSNGVLSVSRAITANPGSGNPIVQSSVAGGTTSWSHTVPSNSNQVMVVEVGYYTLRASSCTVSFSLNPGGTWINAGQGYYVLVNPNAGTGTVTVSGSGCAYPGTSITYYNVDTSNPVNSVASNNGGCIGGTNCTSTTTASLSIATNLTDMVQEQTYARNWLCGTSLSLNIGSRTGLAYTSLQTCFPEEAYESSYSTASATPTTTVSTSFASSVSGGSSGWYMYAIALRRANVPVAQTTGALASFSSNCTITTGACSDTGNILNLNQQYVNATGAVLAIQNSGAGADIQLGSGKIAGSAIFTGSLTAQAAATFQGTTTMQGTLISSTLQTAATNGFLTPSAGIAIQTGSASGISSNSGSITIQTGNAASTAGSITIDTGTTGVGSPTVSLGATNASSVSIGRAAGTIALNGAVNSTFLQKNSSNSTAEFQVQNAAGGSLLNVDSTNSKLTVGQSQLYVTGLGVVGGVGATAGSNQGGTLSGAAATTYYYKVTGLTANGEALASNEASINGASFTPLTAPGAPTVAIGAAGALTGAYTYKVTFVTANGETTGGTTSSVVNPSAQQISLTAIPTGPTGTTARKIYRTAAGGADGTQKLVTTIADNTTTTYTDNLADGSLGAALPGSNTATTNTNNAAISFTAIPGATSYRVYRGTASGAENAYQTTASSPFTDTGAAGTAGSTPTSDATNRVGIGTSAPTANLEVDGNALFKNQVNTTTAFQVQNASGGNLFQIDSQNNQIILNGANPGGIGPWNTSTSFATSRGYGTASVVANGYIYEIGGMNGVTSGTNVYYAKLYADGSTGTWQTANSMPNGVHLATAVTANGYLYVLGGFNQGTGLSSTAVIYTKLNADGSIGTWQTNANGLPLASSGHSSLVANGYIYVFGGSRSTYVWSAKLNPDGSTGTWQTQNALLGVRNYHEAVAANGYVYILGGYDPAGTGTNFNTVYSAKLNSDGTIGSWASQANVLPIATSQISGGVINGYIYVAGASNSSVYFAKVQDNGAIGTWSTSSYSLPVNLTSSSSVVYNGYLYMVGGNVVSGSTLATAYYASASRVKVAGSLDLVGLSSINAADPGSSGIGATGGELTAGNANIIGNLSVTGMANFAQGVGVTNTLSVLGSAAIQTATNSTTAFQVQNASGTPLLTADTSGMKVTVVALVVTGNLTVNGHIITGGSAPTGTANTTNAGTGAACTVSGTDTIGEITINTGTGTLNAGQYCTVTFATAFGATPHVLISPSSQNVVSVRPFVQSVSATGFSINVDTPATISSTYLIEYMAAQ